MPRKRVKTIPISELRCYEQIVAELSERGELEGYEVDKATMTIKEFVAPVIRPENLHKAIVNIELYLHFERDRVYIIIENRAMAIIENGAT